MPPSWNSTAAWPLPAPMASPELLTVAEALALILDSVAPLGAENVALLDALGRVLAKPVVAADSLPPFANSSMDGYAVRAADLARAGPEASVTLRVVADVAAGAPSAPCAAAIR